MAEEDTVDETIRKVSEADQLAASLAQAASMANVMFRELREGGMTRPEAFAMTQTWLAALVGAGRAGDKR